MTGVARIGMIGIAVVGLCQAAQFEVASIKPSAEPPVNRAYTLTDTRVELGSFSLRGLIMMAYKLETYQLDCPEWMATTRFDLLAKLPAGANKEQVPAMLHTLLTERFKLAAHHEDKVQQVYALLSGKDGPKLTEGAADNTDTSFLTGRSLLYRMGTPEDDGIWTISGKNQRNILNAARITLPELASVLNRYVDDPIVDMTGLKGFWRVRMDVPRSSGRIRAAVAAQTGIAPPNDPDDDVSIFASVQKLGLVLDHRKAPVDHLIVDSVEKTPTEN